MSTIFIVEIGEHSDCGVSAYDVPDERVRGFRELVARFCNPIAEVDSALVGNGVTLKDEPEPWSSIGGYGTNVWPRPGETFSQEAVDCAKAAFAEEQARGAGAVFLGKYAADRLADWGRVVIRKEEPTK